MSYRHGDVLILDAVRLPESATRRPSNIIAEGEVTGHAHRINNGEVWEDGEGGILVVAGEEAFLSHEEHKKVELPATQPGYVYPVIIQREYDDENEWRQVAD